MATLPGACQMRNRWPIDAASRCQNLNVFQLCRQIEARKRATALVCHFHSKGGVMELLRNTRQEDDPHGLRVIGELIQFGTADDFEARVRASLPEISRTRVLLERVKQFAPGVEFSPHLVRVMRTAEKIESARLAEVA